MKRLEFFHKIFLCGKLNVENFSQYHQIVYKSGISMFNKLTINNSHFAGSWRQALTASHYLSLH